MPLSQGRLAKIHIACKDLGIDSDMRESMLRIRYNKTSSKDLTLFEADKLLAEFVGMGWKPKTGKPSPNKNRFNDLGRRPGMCTPAMLRKIEAMWQDVSVAPDKVKALRVFLMNRFGNTDLRFLTFSEGNKVIVALKKMQVRECKKGR